MIALNDYVILKAISEDKPSVSGLEIKKRHVSNVATVAEGSDNIKGKQVVFMPAYAEFADINGEEFIFIKTEHIIAII